jgi:predicted nucleotidyltransferase
MSRVELIKLKRNEILSIAQKHGAINLKIFGSVARGEDSVHSDIDLLVETLPKRSAFFPAGLMVELEEVLGCKVDIVTKEALHDCIRESILKEAVLL